jgi:hypothetical protein
MSHTTPYAVSSVSLQPTTCRAPGTADRIWRGRPTVKSDSTSWVTRPPSVSERASRDIEAYDSWSRSPRAARVVGPWTSRCRVTASSAVDNAIFLAGARDMPLGAIHQE